VAFKKNTLPGQFILRDNVNIFEAVFFLIRHGSNTSNAPFCKHHVGGMFATVNPDTFE
jgi:hypothetical protein